MVVLTEELLSPQEEHREWQHSHARGMTEAHGGSTVSLFLFEEAIMDDATAKALQDELDRLEQELGAEDIDGPTAVAMLLRAVVTPTAEQLTEAGRRTAELRKRLDNDPAERQRIHELGESLNIDDKE